MQKNDVSDDFSLALGRNLDFLDELIFYERSRISAVLAFSAPCLNFLSFLLVHLESLVSLSEGSCRYGKFLR